MLLLLLYVFYGFALVEMDTKACVFRDPSGLLFVQVVASGVPQGYKRRFTRFDDSSDHTRVGYFTVDYRARNFNITTNSTP